MKTQVFELIQVLGETALFGDHRTKPETAFSIPRSEWEEEGRPVTITVTAEAGGEFVPRVEKPSEALDRLMAPVLAAGPYGEKAQGGYL